ncbi:MAG: hypothetical protein Q8P11_02540 [bacterium]|nr:hypothetical protein [bacterium]
MKKKITIGVIVVCVIVITLPLLLINDTSNISAKDIACAKHDTKMMLENPIERLVILKTVVDKKEGNTLFTSAYTVAGIKYATVELICDEQSKVTWRRSFGK